MEFASTSSLYNLFLRENTMRPDIRGIEHSFLNKREDSYPNAFVESAREMIFCQINTSNNTEPQPRDPSQPLLFSGSVSPTLPHRVGASRTTGEVGPLCNTCQKHPKTI